MTLFDQFQAARRACTPLVAIQTTEPASMLRGLASGLPRDIPRLIWDCVRGLHAMNRAGEAVVNGLGLQSNEDLLLSSLLNKLGNKSALPDGTILFVMNGTRVFVGQGGAIDLSTVQAIWNLRDKFKSTRKTLVLVGADANLPPEIAHDFTILDEPLPDRQQLADIIANTFRAAQRPAPPTGIMTQCVESLLGLSAFSAEQATAECLSREGINVDALWERKRRLIEQTHGLSVYRGGETFDDLGGLESIKTFLRGVMNGNDKPGVVVFWDEIDKAAPNQHDNTGVSQDQIGCILQHTRDNNSSGLLLLGITGTGKSALAKATGNEGGIPCVQLDTGACKNSLVGESEASLRRALKVIKAVGNGRELWIATCNSLDSLPLELRGRFDLGTWILEVPDTEARDDIWRIWTRKYDLPPTEQRYAHDEQFTGDEIRRTCKIARRLNVSLERAAQYVIPVAQSAPEGIERLRRSAEGRYLDASYPGVYRRNRQTEHDQECERMLAVGDER